MVPTMSPFIPFVKPLVPSLSRLLPCDVKLALVPVVPKLFPVLPATSVFFNWVTMLVELLDTLITPAPLLPALPVTVQLINVSELVSPVLPV
jgi:hypothetical protein